MNRLAVQSRIAEAKSRLALVALLRLNLRCMDNWRELQRKAWGRSFDYESTLILIAVVVIGAEAIVPNKLEKPVQDLATPMPLDRLRKCNISSIAATTSLNRETVRRRVNDLVERKLLAREDDGGVRMAPGVMQKAEVRDALNAQLSAVVRTVNELLGEGVLRLEKERLTDSA